MDLPSRRRQNGPVNGVYGLASLDPDGPDHELDPLAELVGDAELVGLGESVHTSGGFYRAKHRVFAYLVHRHGFRALAIESSWQDAERIGRYLATGEGDPAEVTSRGLYPVWACAETVGLVRWMRRWNVEHPDDALSLFGFDVQQPEEDRDALVELLRGRPGSDQLLSGLENIPVPGWTTKLTDEARREGLARLDALDAELGGDELARLRVVGLRAWYGMAGRTTAPPAVQAREDGMAHALRVLRERHAGGRKTAVCAHNGHLAHATHRAGLRGYWMGAVRGMGTLLREELGDRYRAVALTGSHVATRWPGKDVEPNEGPDNRSGSFDARLRRIGSPYAIVDPAAAEPARGLFGRPRKEWFGRPDQVRIAVREQFAAVLYLDESPAMTPL